VTDELRCPHCGGPTEIAEGWVVSARISPRWGMRTWEDEPERLDLPLRCLECGRRFSERHAVLALRLD
jgi:hypothetical protein